MVTKEVFNVLINFENAIKNNEESFCERFIGLPVFDLYSIHFSTSTVRFYAVLDYNEHSKHFTDSIPIEEFLEWYNKIYGEK